ncbi:MAG TPA: cytochrome c [Euryarchaeota archaeon]|nr:cytochrome c [archaeon BMS3Bbin15]HDL15920.1 cytochrome c [Euryarchaeota archaeon]
MKKIIFLAAVLLLLAAGCISKTEMPVKISTLNEHPYPSPGVSMKYWIANHGSYVNANGHQACLNCHEPTKFCDKCHSFVGGAPIFKAATPQTQAAVPSEKSTSSVKSQPAKSESIVPSAYAGKTNLYWRNQNAIAAGKKIYLTSCVSCHGKTGATQPEADFSSAKWWSSKKDAYLLWKVSDGAPAEGMPGWKSTYKENEVWDVLAYAKTLSK